MTLDEYMSSGKKTAAPTKPLDYWVLVNPEHTRFGGIGWRRVMRFSSRKEAKAYVTENYGAAPNRYLVKIEAVAK